MARLQKPERQRKRRQQINGREGVVAHAPGLRGKTIPAGQQPHPVPGQAFGNPQADKGGIGQPGQEGEGDNINEKEKPVAVREYKKRGHQPLHPDPAHVHPPFSGNNPVPPSFRQPMENSGKAISQRIVIVGGVKNAAQKSQPPYQQKERRKKTAETAGKLQRRKRAKRRGSLANGRSNGNQPADQRQAIAGRIQMPQRGEDPSRAA